MNVNEVAKMLDEYSKEREKNGAQLNNTNLGLLKHCAGEVIEAVVEELADVIACILILCARENIDVEYALTQCLAKNLQRAEGKGAKA